MNKTYLILILFVMLSSILKFKIITTIYLYMPIVLIVWMLSLNYIKINKLYLFEIVFLALYMYIMISSLWSINYSLSLQLIIGEIVLLLSYFILRHLVLSMSFYEVECIFFMVAKWFTILSTLLYLVGIFYFFVFKISPSPDMYLNEHTIGIFGLYLEGLLPRFRGLSESPNNYLYIGFLTSLFFIYKRHFYLALLAVLTIIFTISGTGFIALVVVFILNSLMSIKRAFGISLLVIIIAILGVYSYSNNIEFHQIISLRYERMLTGSGRYELWDYILGVIKDSPYFGYGANTTRVLLDGFRGYQSAHNSFLDIAVTTGIVGLFLESSLFFVLFITSLKLQKYYHSHIFVTLWIFYLIISLSNDTLHVGYSIFYLFFIFVYNKNMHKKLNVLSRSVVQ